MKSRIKKLEQVAADHHEKEILSKMKEDADILKASLAALENDASKVSIPRKFRSY